MSEFNVKVKLTGKNGNAFNLLGICQSAAKKAKIEDAKIKIFMDEAMSGDYSHLLATCTKYFTVS